MNPNDRDYSNGIIIVHWRPALCIHCKACVGDPENYMDGLPEVFDLNARPWVNMAGATTERIRKQVAECPSGALSISEVPA